MSKNLQRWRVREGQRMTFLYAPDYQAAKLKAASKGFLKPWSLGLTETEAQQVTSRNKAIAAFRAGLTVC